MSGGTFSGSFNQHLKKVPVTMMGMKSLPEDYQYFRTARGEESQKLKQGWQVIRFEPYSTQETTKCLFPSILPQP